MTEQFTSIMHKGGPVMWPLLVLSLISVTLSFERALYWVRQNGPAAKRGFVSLMDSMRRGDRTRSAALADTSDSVYARVARALLADGAGSASPVADGGGHGGDGTGAFVDAPGPGADVVRREEIVEPNDCDRSCAAQTASSRGDAGRPFLVEGLGSRA